MTSDPEECKDLCSIHPSHHRRLKCFSVLQAVHQGALMRFQPVSGGQKPAEILVRGTSLRPFNTDKSVAAYFFSN